MSGEISLVLHLNIRVFRATLIDDGLEKYRQDSKHFQALQVLFFFFKHCYSDTNQGLPLCILSWFTD